jgi:hypothetical protein
VGLIREDVINNKWYEAILHVYKLNPNLDLLREGDATRIRYGSGHILSGG